MRPAGARIFIPTLLLSLLVAYGLGQLIRITPVGALRNLPPCPRMEHHTRASEIRIAPGLDRHQNWIGFPVPERFAGLFVFCLDGELLYSGGGNLTFDDGVARFNVATSWVNVQYVRGLMDEYRAEDRWELGLTCQPSDGCSSWKGAH